MTCAQPPVPHHLGPCVVFAVPPVFVLPPGTVGARLVVVEGPGGLFGQTNGVGVAGGEGEGVAVTFMGCGVDTGGEYVFGCEYVMQNGGSQPVVVSQQISVLRRYYPSDIASGVVMAVCGAILHVVASSTGKIPGYIERVGAAINGVAVSNALPLPAKALVIYIEKVTAQILSKITTDPVTESLSFTLRENLFTQFKQKTVKANGKTAGKSTVLRVSKEDFTRENEVLRKIPSVAVRDDLATPHMSMTTVKITKKTLVGHGAFLKVTEEVAGAAVDSLELSGFVVVLPSRIVCPSGVVAIKAHLLVLPPGGCDIDVSSSDTTTKIAQPTAKPGEHGTHGTTGASAGSITIHAVSIVSEKNLDSGLVLSATGGDGGDGQHGGMGRQGSPGDTPGSPGQPGGRGGNGGNAGTPGSPGQIVVQTTLKIPNHVQVVVTADPGKPGVPGKGGVGGDGGEPGPPDLTPTYTSSGWWWDRDYTIQTTETSCSQCRKPGRQGDSGTAGEPNTIEPIPLPAATCTVPVQFLWGQVLPKHLVGLLLQSTEVMYQKNSGGGGRVDELLAAVTAAASIMAKSGRAVDVVSRRATLLRLQLTKGYCYWGYRKGYYPLMGAGELCREVENVLSGYKECHGAWKAGVVNVGREEVLRWKVHEARGAAATSRDVVFAQLVEFKKAEGEVLESLSSLSRKAAVCRKSLSATAADFTKAVAEEATRQALKNFRLTDNAEFFQKAMTVLSTCLSVYPALPPHPSVIDGLIAQGRGQDEAVSLYLKMAQDSLLSIGAHLVSAGREFWRDDAAVKQKTEEALSQVILESQQDKSTLPLQEVDRWVAGVGLSGERVEVRDKYLSEVRRYQMCLQEVEEGEKKVEAVGEKVKELEGVLERAEGEVRTLSETQGRVGLRRGEVDVLDATWAAAKRLTWMMRLLALAVAREAGGSPHTVCIPGSEPPEPGFFQSGFLRMSTGLQERVLLKKFAPRRRVTASIQFTSEKLLEALATNGSCIFGVGPTDTPTLSLLTPDPTLHAVTLTLHPQEPTEPSNIAFHILGTPSISRVEADGTTTVHAHPPITSVLPEDGRVVISDVCSAVVSPFTLFKVAVEGKAVGYDSFELELEVSCSC